MHGTNMKNVLFLSITNISDCHIFKGFIPIYKNIYVIITVLLLYCNLLLIYCPGNTINSCTVKHFSVFVFAETIEYLKYSRWRLTAGTKQSAENKRRTEANTTTEQYELQFVRWTANRHFTWTGKKEEEINSCFRCNCSDVFVEYTYLLTPRSRILLEKLIGLQLVKKLPAFYRTRNFVILFTSVLHLSLSWASSI